MLVADSLSLSLLQIESLIYSSGKKTHKGNFTEANQLIESHKEDAELHFIRSLFSAVDFSPYEPKTGQKDVHQAQQLSQEFNSILSKPNFQSLLCYAIDKPLPSSKGFGPSRQLLPQIARLLKLSRVQEVILGLALSQSRNAQLVHYAQQWVRQKLPELIKTHLAEIAETSEPSSSSTGPDGAASEAQKSILPTGTRSTCGSSALLHEVGIELLHYLISHVLDDSEHLGVSDQPLKSLLTSLRREFPRSRISVCLSALLHPDILELSPIRALCPCTSLTVFVAAATSKPALTNSERTLIGDRETLSESIALDTPADPSVCIKSLVTNNALSDPDLVADLLEEFGPVCTQSLDVMRLTLAEFGPHELTPLAVAKCICLFMRLVGSRQTDAIHGQDSQCPTNVGLRQAGPRRASHQVDTLDLDTQIILRTASSGVLWRETTGGASSASPQSTTRPSSLFIPNSICDHLSPYSLSASEPRLNCVDSGATQSSFSSRPNESQVSSAQWNIENFLTVVDELNPTLDMDQVAFELDCPEFFVTSRAAFALLKSFLFHGNRTGRLEIVCYRPWNNAHGQLSLLRHCYIYPDVVCLAYYPFRCVDLSLYRLSQTEDQAMMHIWKNIDFVQTLLTLSERGVFHEVHALLEQAFVLCPNILTATLLETNQCALRSVILGHALVYFLSPRPNSQVVLQSAWNGTATSQLTASDSRTQRHLLLASILEYVAQLTVVGVLEPTTLPEVAGGDPTGTYNLTRLVELLASVTETNACHSDELTKGSTILTVLLGTTEAPSSAVSSLLLSPMPLAASGATVYSIPLPASLLPTPTQAIDLALVLLIRMANGVVSRTTGRTGTGASGLNPAVVATVQNAIKLFLSQWFTEYMRDKELADSFAYGIVDYLRLRYTPHVIGSSVPSCNVRCASSISALPGDLRKPSQALLTHIICSAQAALKSPSCSVRDTVVTEVNQAFSFFLQNLGHTVSFSTATNLSSLTVSNSVAQTGNRISAVNSTSAFGLDMKPGTGPPGPQNPQSQTRSTGLSSGGANLQQHYQPTNLATAAALAAVSSFSTTPDDFSRSAGINALTSRLSQTNLSQHQGSSLPLQRKVTQQVQGTGLSDGMRNLVSGSVSTPMDHTPVALSFSSEPLEIEMNKEAEAEANTFFQKLLGGSSSPEDMFKTVCEYATQGNLAQRRLLDGILRMLADEVSQFLQDYPEPMLPQIANLYGSILAASTHLLSIRALSMLWRAVIARLHQFPPDTSMEIPLFRAMVLILIKAKNTFTQFFNLPNCLVMCPVFKQFPHELQEYLLNAEMIAKNYVLSHQSTSSGTKSGQFQGSHQALSCSTPGSSTQLSTMAFTAPPPLPSQSDLLVKPPDPPEEAVSDRIYFLFNNVSKTNVKEKSTELADLLLTDERIQPWFAFYLVGKRVPVEHTFHDLFALVLDHVQEKVPNVRPRIMQELIRNIKLLLRNIRLDRDDMQARSTLKNLGSFLGLITLARNKPLLHDDLNVKDLIYEAYHKGPIPTQYVVPFVARVVRGATESIVFQPPNPWTMAILKVFRELYDMRDVKDCLRFEIEILYRAFKLNLEDVQLAYFLRDPNHLANLEVHLCFLVTASTVTASISLDTATVSMAGVPTGAEQSGATTATSLSNATDLVPVSSNMTSQQQMLTMLAALQKQQIAGSQNTNLDVANLMQSSLASSVGNTGGRSQASHTLALAAAMASGQQQKQPPQTQQQQPQQQPFVSGSTGAGSATAGSQSLAFAQQQKQMAAAAVAALQTQWHSQQQQQPSMLSGASAPSQYSNIGGPSNQHNIPDSTNDVPLRYEEVSIRTIRNCLNLDELIAAAAAAAASNRSGGPTNNAATAAVALLQANPRLRGLIEPAITRAINELTTPVFERCARITVTTVAAIVRKDFALDPNPNRMLFAARQMVRHLAAGMSLTTAREALGVSLVTTLKNIILVEVQSASGQEKEAVQRLAHFLVAEAMHACLAFMQKSVAEKAVSDIEQKLEPDLKLRAEMSPRRFLEQASSQLAAQQAKVPEPLKLKVGGPTPAEMAVYEEFGRVIPGFAPSTSPNSTAAPSSLNHASMMQPSSPNAAVAMAAYLQQQQQQQQQQDFSRIQRQVSAPNTGSAVMMLKPLMSQSQVTAQSHQLLLQQQQQQQAQISQAPITGLFDKIIGQIERHVAAISARLRSTTDPMIRSLRCLIDAVHLAKTSRDANVAMNVIATMVQSFLEHYRPGCWRNQPHGLETMEHLKEAHMLTLRHMLSSDQAPFGCAWVTSQVTQTWIRLDGGSLSGDRSSRTPSGNATTDPNAKDGVHVGKSETEENTTNEANRDQAASIWSGGWKSQTDGAASVEATSSEQNRLGSIKWNWEAFAELLKVHVVYLSQVDAYLAKEVSAGHPGAISFVIDLLDHFVLPCPSGTAVGAAAAAAAAAAANYVRSAPPVMVNGTQTNAPTGPNSSSTTTSGSLSTISPSTKREFTVLNEYDLWSTLEAMRTRVSTLNAAMSANSVAGNRINTTSLTDPLALRLRLACARVRGLLDLGLLEQSPLFATPPGCAQPPISALYAGCSQAREFDDPPTLQEKVELLMRNWVEIYQSPRQRDANTIDALLAQLVQIGVLANMDNLTRFLRLATIFVVERALKQLKLQDQQQQHALQMPPVGSGLSVTRVAAYIELDAYTRLISIVIKRGGVQAEQPNFKVVLLNKVLGIIAGMLLQEHEVRRDWFYTMPFERILIMLFVELHPPVTVSEMEALHSTGCVSMSIDGVVGTTASTETGGNSAGDVSKTVAPADKTLNTDTRGLLGRNLTLQQQLPLIFCHLLHCLRPERASAFVFAWLEMLAHRWFVDRILSAPGPPELRAAYQAMYAQLLVDLLKFLAYFLQNAVMVKPIQCLYKATLRLFLVLIHDFPEFVSDYYALFCDVVPSNSIQLRNLILSALPKRGMPSADPVQAPPVDHLASLEDPTGYCMEAGSRLPEPMRRELDAYLASRAPVKLLSELVTMLRRADDVLPPFPPPQFAHHPQQQARHQQALVAYAVALAANDTPAPAGSVLSNTKSSEKPTGDDSSVAASGSQPKKFNAGKHATESSAESGELAATNTISTEDSMSSASRSAPSPSLSTSSAAAAALQWGVRATQQLATFGLADGMHYNVELMNNLTLYVCITAIRSLREKGMPLNMSTIAHTPQMDIIQSLVLNLDNEGRYLLLNCMANQLRYPNSHTYYFSYTILYLFSEQSKEQVKEQISRVLLERLIVNRPHPWGLLMTGAELLRNPAYRFWEHEFARCHPEIEHIVTVVARSCIPNFQLPAINPSGGSSIASSNVVPGLRSALSSSVPHGRRQASPLTRGTANVGGAVHPSNLPTPLLTE